MAAAATSPSASGSPPAGTLSELLDLLLLTVVANAGSAPVPPSPSATRLMFDFERLRFEAAGSPAPSPAGPSSWPSRSLDSFDFVFCFRTATRPSSSVPSPSPSDDALSIVFRPNALRMLNAMMVLLGYPSAARGSRSRSTNSVDAGPKRGTSESKAESGAALAAAACGSAEFARWTTGWVGG